MSRQGFYFGAGPAALPTPVVEQAAQEFIEFDNQGVGLGELSHRSGQATKIMNEAKAQIKELLKVPDTHEILFLQGGGTGGFAACLYAQAAYKFYKSNGQAKSVSGDYIVTGVWSLKALAESKRLGIQSNVIAKAEKFVEIPKIEKVNGDFVYYCDNETVHGIEIQGEKTTPPVDFDNVCVDISSNMFSRPIDVSKYSIIFGGAQKNLGIPGVTLYIVRKDIIEAQEKVDIDQLRNAGFPVAPSFLDVGLAVKNNSAYNTVSIFAIEVIKLVTARLLANGGIPEQTKISKSKAEKLYNAVDSRKDIYVTNVKPEARSRMNVVFNLKNPEDEERFLKEATALKLRGLKGHRSVGGIRVSNYNAVTEEACDAVVKFILDFK